MTNPTVLNPIFVFLNGAVCFGAATCALFFFRFWVRSRDRLFLVFGTSFSLLALERLMPVFLNVPRDEDHLVVYLIRLVAFLLILAGIWDKNRAHEPSHAH